MRPKLCVGDAAEHLAPDRRREGEVVAARPLVAAEDHRAVLDRDLHAALAGVGDERRPDLVEDVDSCRRSSAPCRGPTNVPTVGHAEPRGRVDHLASGALATALARRGVGIERVRVVGQRARSPARARTGRRRSRAPAVVEPLDVDVADAGVAAHRALGRRPAGDLERLEAVGGGPVGDLVEGRSGNAAVSSPSFMTAWSPSRISSTVTQRPSRALRAIAAPISASSWPSANVG